MWTTVCMQSVFLFAPPSRACRTQAGWVRSAKALLCTADHYCTSGADQPATRRAAHSCHRVAHPTEPTHRNPFAEFICAHNSECVQLCRSPCDSPMWRAKAAGCRNVCAAGCCRVLRHKGIPSVQYCHVKEFIADETHTSTHLCAQCSSYVRTMMMLMCNLHECLVGFA